MIFSTVRPSRRSFLASAVAAMAGAPTVIALENGRAVTAKSNRTNILRLLEPVDGTALGTAFGAPWPRGAVTSSDALALRQGDEMIAVQNWPLAYWPDGSLKWTGHAVAPGIAGHQTLTLGPGTAAPPAQAVTIHETADKIVIDTAVIECEVPRRGETFLKRITRDKRDIAQNAHLICLRQETFTSDIEKVTLEQAGPVRAVVRIDGKHSAEGRAWLPFTLRLYFYAGAESVRIIHTFIFDGDQDKDFIQGIGVRLEVPMRDPLHDRHVRFAGEGDGLWAEAVRNLSGLRRDAGRAAIEKQLAGEACPPLEQIPPAVRDRLHLVPAWSDFTLYQSSADSFEIRKRTKSEGVCWITAAHGHRAAGLGYIGAASGGGVAFGLRDFWQRHPTQLDVRSAASDVSEVTLWLFSPQAQPMDLRFYHGGMGMDTHAEQLEGLEITYEDYEPGFATAHGIARTSEIHLSALPQTPSRSRLVELAHAVQRPPQFVCAPQDYLDAGVFGSLWTLPDRSTPQKKRIEDELDFLIDYYQKQIEQRRWYGFWDYGDVMHSYDADRHEWRYDVGGYAWDNSELSTDLWLWYSFLRTGRADIFRMAEAMTRHTGEVDVYHLGRFAGLGSRHNVRHWGCSAKQMRISNALYRRFYYFLTADERVGDLMRELVDADKNFAKLDPQRKVRKEPFTPQPHALGVSFGTDWGSLAAAWLTEWERTRDPAVRDKLLAGMRTIGAMPKGFFTDGATYDPDTGAFTAHGDRIAVTHLAAVFGLPEICAELLKNFDVPEFEKAWLQYCRLYSASVDEQQRELGQGLKGSALTSAHSRLTAYAAWKMKDPTLAARAWKEFHQNDPHLDAAPTPQRYSGKTVRITGTAALNPVDEAAWVSTNDASQWSLAAMQNLALVGDAMS